MGDRPFVVGDYVRSGQDYGVVIEIVGTVAIIKNEKGALASAPVRGLQLIWTFDGPHASKA